MTETGYEFLVRKIKEAQIDIPVTMTLDELQGWLEGYRQCQNSVLHIIEELKKDSGMR